MTWQRLRRVVLRCKAWRLRRQMAREQAKLLAYAETHGAELLAAVMAAVNGGKGEKPTT